jgi:ParB family chromosome partitioning protein
MAGKKRGLGRGLDALLGPSSGPANPLADTTKSGLPETNAGGLQHLPVEWLRPGRFQPRRQFDHDSLEELAQSIKVHGVMQPLVIQKTGDQQFELIAGERRWRAAQIAGLPKVPCLIREATPQNQLAMSIIENLQREDLNPMDEAFALARLIEEFSLTHQEVAEIVGKSRAAVSNAIRLSKLGKVAAEFLVSGQIEMGHARALLTLEAETQATTAREIVAKQLSVRQTENLVKRQLQPAPVVTAAAASDADVAKLEQRLGAYFGQTVKIKKKGARKGELIITYNSLEELEGVLNRSGFTAVDDF